MRIKLPERYLFISILLLGAGVLAGNALFFEKYSIFLSEKRNSQKRKNPFISLRVSPGEAEVFLDGEPFSGGEVTPGSHTISVRADGYYPFEKKISLTRGEYRKLNIRLRPKPIRVIFETEPHGVSLYLRGREVGETPLTLKLFPGNYPFILRKGGFPALGGELILSPGRGELQIFRRLGGFRRIRERDRSEMVWIPGGDYTVGLTGEKLKIAAELCRKLRGEKCPDRWWFRQRKVRRVSLAGFWIDGLEISRDKYRSCVKAGFCKLRRGVSLSPGRYPVVGITRREAEAYCRWVGARLPTAAEWEVAGRGGDGRLFPWGENWQLGRANLGRFDRKYRRSSPDPADGFRFFSPVGAVPGDRSPFGVSDLAGNVREWTASCGGNNVGDTPLSETTVSCDRAVIKGGSWRSPPWEGILTYREVWPAGEGRLDVGFRCARD